MTSLGLARGAALATSSAVALAAGAVPALAQDAGEDGRSLESADEDRATQSNSDQEIIVTARRRSESEIDVPVLLTAFSGEQLVNAGVQNVSDISRMTPQLSIEPNVAAYGGSLTLRGVTSPTSNTSAEPAVTINVDGVPLAIGSAVRLGQLDLGQVEILKGPQALFFGKNSSGGIVALKSAEPTRDFYAVSRVGYEIVSTQAQFETIVSGPLSDDLGVRVAGRITTPDRYFINDAAIAGVRVTHPKGPGQQNQSAKATVLYAPTGGIRARLTGIYDAIDDDGTYFNTQRIYCPLGAPQGATASPLITDCVADRHLARGDFPANIAAITGDSKYRNGVPYNFVKQGLAVLDVSVPLAEDISFNSITGYYDLKSGYADPATRGPFVRTLANASNRKRTFSEELRLQSDGSGPFSWMLGAFYADDSFDDTEHVALGNPNGTIGTIFPESIWHIDSKTYSAFAQAAYKFANAFSLSVGGRYSRDEKSQASNLSTKFIPSVTFTDFSPEVTASYNPDSNLNVFVSYKEGFKAGTFQLGSLNFRAPIANPAITTIDNSYAPERVKGVEAGIKAYALDRQLRLSLGAYDYKYSDLQLSLFDPVLLITTINNAAAAKVTGVEADFSYRPRGVPGLQIIGALTYNRARYTETFLSACYTGQTIALGCSVDTNNDGKGDFQDLDGRPLPRAPKWAGNLGFNYDVDVGSFKLGLDALANYQSFSFLSQEEVPQGIRPGQVLLDAGVRLSPRSEAWEVAIIGKNLTNRFYGVSGAQESATGVSSTTGTNSGQPGDYFAVVNKGRQVILRLSLRFDAFGK